MDPHGHHSFPNHPSALAVHTYQEEEAGEQEVKAGGVDREEAEDKEDILDTVLLKEDMVEEDVVEEDVVEEAVVEEAVDVADLLHIRLHQWQVKDY